MNDLQETASLKTTESFNIFSQADSTAANLRSLDDERMISSVCLPSVERFISFITSHFVISTTVRLLGLTSDESFHILKVVFDDVRGGVVVIKIKGNVTN